MTCHSIQDSGREKIHTRCSSSGLQKDSQMDPNGLTRCFFLFSSPIPTPKCVDFLYSRTVPSQILPPDVDEPGAIWWACASSKTWPASRPSWTIGRSPGRMHLDRGPHAERGAREERFGIPAEPTPSGSKPQVRLRLGLEANYISKRWFLRVRILIGL